MKKAKCSKLFSHHLIIPQTDQVRVGSRPVKGSVGGLGLILY